MLPPWPGQHEWREYLLVERGGFFMIFRVSAISARHECLRGRCSCPGSSLTNPLDRLTSCCMGCCCAPFTPLYNEYAAHEVPLEVQNSLRMNRHPVHAHVEMVNEVEESHILHNRGFNR